MATVFCVVVRVPQAMLAVLPIRLEPALAKRAEHTRRYHGHYQTLQETHEAVPETPEKSLTVTEYLARPDIPAMVGAAQGGGGSARPGAEGEGRGEAPGARRAAEGEGAGEAGEEGGLQLAPHFRGEGHRGLSHEFSDWEDDGLNPWFLEL